MKHFQNRKPVHPGNHSPFLFLFRGMLVVIFLLTLCQVGRVSAQESQQETAGTGPNDWTTPINLSNSGAVKDPVILPLANNKMMVAWLDSYSGYQFTQGDGTKWSKPVTIPSPYDTWTQQVKVLLRASNTGILYCFWIDSNHILNYAAVDTHPTTDAPTGWTINRVITRDVANFDVVIDEIGDLHIAYILGLDSNKTTSGLYYIRVTAKGDTTVPIVLDQSPYYRILGRQQGEASLPANQIPNVSINQTAGDAKTSLHVVWTSPETRRLYLRQSTDSGLNWKDRKEVVSPNGPASSSTPRNLSLEISHQTLILFWQDIQGNASCTQYYQYSNDGGASWSSQEPLFDGMDACPLENQIIPGPKNQTLLLSSMQDTSYLLNWNNKNFETPFPLTDLARFSDPQTSSSIKFGCQTAEWISDRLYVAGCGISDSTDVWITSRPVSALLEQMTTRTGWSAPTTISSVQAKTGFLALLTDPSGLVHAFWTQADGMLQGDLDRAIYYTGWTKQDPRQPTAILTTTEGQLNQPSFITNAKDRMYMVWSGGKTDDLYFSWGATGQIISALDWYKPLLLPTPRPAAVEPKIQVGQDGTIYVAYLIPVNENRGVYLVQSKDRGETWSKPAIVFDASAANCEILKDLSFVNSVYDTLHLSWVCTTDHERIEPAYLRYAQSTDGGEKWDVRPEENQRTITWQELTTSVKGSLHQIWQENQDGRLVMMDQVSQDDGMDWSEPNPFSSSDQDLGPISLAADPAGQLYLIQVAQSKKNLELQYNKWDGTNWTPGQNEIIGEGAIDQVKAVAATVVPDGNLVVMYSISQPAPTSGIEMNHLEYRTLPVEIPAFEPIKAASRKSLPQKQETPTASTDSQAIPTTDVQQQVEPTINLSAIKNDPSENSGKSNISIFLIGSALSVALVAAAFFLQIRRRTKS